MKQNTSAKYFLFFHVFCFEFFLHILSSSLNDFFVDFNSSLPNLINKKKLLQKC